MKRSRSLVGLLSAFAWGELAGCTSSGQPEPELTSQAQAVSGKHLFERGVFTSGRARFVAALAGQGVPLAQIPVPEDFMALTPQEQRGRDVYAVACSACHGSATTTRITRPEVHAFFSSLQPDGNVRYTPVPGQGPVRVQVPHPNDGFLPVGFSFFSYMEQLGLFPTYNASVALPRYRFRFYDEPAPGPSSSGSEPRHLTTSRVQAGGRGGTGTPNRYPTSRTSLSKESMRLAATRSNRLVKAGWSIVSW
nr:hypothetical protein [Stigmatella hybrida]